MHHLMLIYPARKFSYFHFANQDGTEINNQQRSWPSYSKHHYLNKDVGHRHVNPFTHNFQCSLFFFFFFFFFFFAENKNVRLFCCRSFCCAKEPNMQKLLEQKSLTCKSS